MRFNSHILVPTIAIAAISLASCSSRPEPRGGDRPDGPPQGQGYGQVSADQIGYIARPISILFASMDSDDDYIVSLEEMSEGINREWLSFPRRNDAHFSTFEYEDWAAAALGDSKAMPNRISFDTNLDGRVSKIEFEDRLRKEFVTLDTNGDTQLTRSELLTMMPRMNQSRGMSGGGQRGGGEGGGRGQRPQR